MKKRVWALLLAVVLAFSVLAGCAKQENTPADTKEPSNQTDPTPSGDDKTDAPAEASQDVFPLAETYNVSAFAFGNTGEELDKTLTMQVMEERTNIHWDISTASQAELSEKRGLSFNSGEYYDVYIKSGISATEAFQYGSQGILIPLNDLIDQYMPNPRRFWTSRISGTRSPLPTATSTLCRSSTVRSWPLPPSTSTRSGWITSA